MIQICTCVPKLIIITTGSLEGIWCDDWCCGCWCHGDMNQDTSIHRADSDAHCIHPTSQMIILLKIVPRAVWPSMATRIQVMAWCLCGTRPMPEPIYPVLSVSSIYDKTRWLVSCFCVCVCILCEFSSFFLTFLIFLIWFSIHCYVQLCMYRCFFVQLLRRSRK